MAIDAQAVNATTKKITENHHAKAVQEFLNYIAWGHQNEAEAMLKANKELALASGNITDHAKRTFKNITGFQYAVWALDEKMWSMILQYLPLDAALEQGKGFVEGSWVKEHACHTNWSGLINALGVFCDKFEFRIGSWNWDKLGEQWVEQVGSAQFKLPMHVLQEYCNQNRRFMPCPDFSIQYQLHRTLPNWLEKSIKNAKFDFGILRCSFSSASREEVRSLGAVLSEAFSNDPGSALLGNVASRGGSLSEERVRADQTALISLYKARIQQLYQLVDSLVAHRNTGEFTRKQYLDNYIANRNHCSLHLFSAPPQTLAFEQTPALVSEKNNFQFIVNTNAGLQKIKAPQGMVLRLTELVQSNNGQKKISLQSGDPVIEWIKLTGGHNSSILDLDNNTALHHAAMKGQMALIDSLSRYETYYAQNKMGLTPLLLAAKYGKLEMVMALLSKAPQSAIAQNDLLSVLVSHEQQLIFYEILKQKNIYEALLVKVGQFHLNNKDANPDRKLMEEAAIGQMYKTALDVKSISMLALLIQIHPEGLNILYRGQSPLHYAIRLKFENAVHLLVEKGSDLALQSLDKLTPLMLAKKEALDFVHYLNNEYEKAVNIKKQIMQKKIEAEANRLTFMTELLESFKKQNLPSQKAFLQNGENLGRLKEALTEVIKEMPDNSFVSTEYPKLSTLNKALNEMLFEKIQENKLSKPQSIGSDLFEKKQLLEALRKVIQSSSQPTTIEVKMKDETFNVLSQSQVLFCERFEKEFDEAFSYFRALALDQVISKKDLEEQQNLEKMKVVATAVLPNVPVPTPVGTISIPTGTLVSAALTFTQYVKEYYRKKEAACMVDLFRAVTAYERTHFIRYTAEQIAYMYRNQIHHLMPGSEGIEVFAQCAAARVVEYIISDKSHQIGYEPGILVGVIRKLKSLVLNQEIPPELQQQKTLYDIFLHGILRVTSKFPTERHTLQTINHLTQQDKWCSKEIFENTGILTTSGDRYAHKDVDLVRYGYCYGSIEEANRRRLNLGPEKGKVWSPGRQWVQVEQTRGLDALPANHVPQSSTVMFSAAAPKAEVAAGSQQNIKGVKPG